MAEIWGILGERRENKRQLVDSSSLCVWKTVALAAARILCCYDDAGATNPGIESVHPARATEVAKKMTTRR